MKQITLSIDNPTVENVLYNLSRQQNKPIEKVLVELIIQVLDIGYQEPTIKLEYKTLDPDKYMTKIKYDTYTDLSIGEEKPFRNISNSAEYVKILRKNVWSH